MSRRHDPVTPELRHAVFARDKGCVAPRLGARDPCRGMWGNPITLTRDADLTLDHIQDWYGRMGRRAVSDAAHLVCLCWGHHLAGWATSHRAELRAYLAEKEVGR